MSYKEFLQNSSGNAVKLYLTDGKVFGSRAKLVTKAAGLRENT